jgi:hypothetical protein
MKIIEQKFDESFPLKSRLASYRVFSWSPAILKKDTGYSVRIIMSGGYGKTSWDYFDMDSTGLILTSPRGLAKQFNNKIRYTDMDEMVEKYKEKVINQF